MSTCTAMMETCRREQDCKAGENITLTDDNGDPILGPDNQPQTVVCNKTSSVLSDLTGSATAALQDFDASETAASAGSAASSAGSAASSAYGSLGGGRRNSAYGLSMGSGWAALEATRREIIMDAIRKWRPDRQVHWRSSASGKGDAVKARTRMLSDGVVSLPDQPRLDSVSGPEGRRKEVEDTTEMYWAQFEGMMKLSDFSQVGQRCEHCLTPTQLSLGKMCEKNTPEYKCMYTTRQQRGDCTSEASPRLYAPSVLVVMIATVTSILTIAMPHLVENAHC